MFWVKVTYRFNFTYYCPLEGFYEKIGITSSAQKSVYRKKKNTVVKSIQPLLRSESKTKKENSDKGPNFFRSRCYKFNGAYRGHKKAQTKFSSSLTVILVY